MLSRLRIETVPPKELDKIDRERINCPEPRSDKKLSQAKVFNYGVYKVTLRCCIRIKKKKKKNYEGTYGERRSLAHSSTLRESFREVVSRARKRV